MSVGQSPQNGRADDRLLFVAEKPPLAAVRIERADADTRPAAGEPGHETIGQPGLGQHALRGQLLQHAAQRGVQRDMNDGQPGGRSDRRVGAEIEHHGKVVDAADLGQQLGMARVVVPGPVQGFFLERRGGHGIDAARQRQTSGRRYGVEGRLAGPGVERAGRHRQRVVGAAGDTGNDARRRFGLLGRLDVDHLEVGLPECDGAAQEARMAELRLPFSGTKRGVRAKKLQNYSDAP